MPQELTDAKGRPVVAVTGMGLVTPLGRGVADNWDALTRGRSGLKTVSRFPPDGLRTRVAGTVDFMGPSPYSAYGLSLAMAEAVGEGLLAQAGLDAESGFPGPLFVVTPPSEPEWPQLRALFDAAPATSPETYDDLIEAVRTADHRFADMLPGLVNAAMPDALAERFGTKGCPVSVCTACASGASAIQLAVEAIRRGETQAALAIASDGTVHPEGMVRFSLLSALSTHNEPPEKASRPFARDRNGFVIAEGAAAFVLESWEAAQARGARVLGVVRGCGEKADDYHRTRSRPDGSAIIGAIAHALEDAGIAPDAIDYINAHGTGTPENDKMEYLSLHAVFGDAIHQVPISSNKSMIGHTLLAAGGVEAAFSLMTIATGIMPPTINYDEPDPAIPLDVVPNEARQGEVRMVLSNSFGFGGQNVCLVLSAEPEI